MELNSYVFEHFEELRSYIYLQNIKHRRIRNIINNSGVQDFIRKNEGHFIQYYCKELKYILRENIAKQISF